VLNFFENVMVVTSAIGGSLVLWWLVVRFWPSEQRREHNEITGWQLSVLGTTYAVILGFMLFAAWADFKAADENAEVEAVCLVNLFWAASGLPENQRDEIRRLALQYADTILEEEWPAMSRGGMAPGVTKIVQQMWETAVQKEDLTATEQTSLDKTMSEIGSITEHRRIRQLQNESKLPGILWLVLLVGGLVTIMSASLFGSQRPMLHMIQIVTLTLLLSLALAAVADINRPFRGFVHVSPNGFENAKRIFERYGGSQEAR